MTDSKQWALNKLEQANTIFEPGEKPWQVQLLDFAVWAAELAGIWWLATRLGF